MIQKINAEDLRKMEGEEGLILQGCGGDAQEWLDGINDLLTKEGILQNGKNAVQGDALRLWRMEKALLSGNFVLAASHLLPVILYSVLATTIAAGCFLGQMKKQ